MHDFDDKTQTFQFEAVKEEPQTTKPQQNRSQNDEFTAARKGRGYEIYDRKEKSNAALIGIASALTVLLVITIVVGIFILKSDNENPQNEGNSIVQNETSQEPTDKEIPEIQNLTVACKMVFYGVGTRENNGEYIARADLYDQEMYQFDSRDIIIDEDTDIRQDGKRLTPQALVYLIENSGGESIVFEGEIKDEDGRAISISFETPVIEEPQEENTEEPTEEEGEVSAENNAEAPVTEQPTEATEIQ